MSFYGFFFIVFLVEYRYSEIDEKMWEKFEDLYRIREDELVGWEREKGREVERRIF